MPMAEGHEGKAKVIIHKDFNTYETGLLEELKGAQGCVWALGISATQVSKPDYIKITYDYPLAAAKAFSTLSPDSPFTFVYVSGEGTTTTPGMFTPFFGKIKGQAEAALLALHKSNPNFRPYSLRPAGIDFVAHPEIHPFMPKQPMAYSMLLPVMRKTWSNMVSPTRDLGKVLTELALSQGDKLEGKGIEGEGRTIANIGFRRIAGI